MVEVLLRGMTSFPCRKGAPIGQAGAPPSLEESNLLLPPHVLWAGLAVFYWVWPVWVLRPCCRWPTSSGTWGEASLVFWASGWPG